MFPPGALFPVSGLPGWLAVLNRLDPITYAVDGRQFIAVPAGTGGGQWITTIPADTLPDKPPPPAGNALFVFALPR